MDSVDRMRARFPEAFALEVEKIRRAGTDNLSHFGNGYEREGGYSLQQHPEELAALTLLISSLQVSDSYLEVGSASGGTARILHESLLFVDMRSIDDGTHHRYPELAENFASLPMKHLKADSHGPEAKAWLEAQGLNYDVVFIDGDHTFDGVWADVQLTRPHWRLGSLVVFHDIRAVGDVRKAWEKGSAENLWAPLAEYVGGKYRPLGIGVGVAL